ncbi:TPA: hypothetical protein EYP26_04385, partial [Candidatus Bathyarchaeota archaeon]|nr:hypothetical protein [Candidatus Bathyarchaeota archaeon]
MDNVVKRLFLEGCALREEIEGGKFIEFGEEKIAYIQPCASEKGKVTADIMMGRDEATFFEPSILCSILEAYKPMLAEGRCSRPLGVAVIKWKGRSITIFKNGRVNIKRALTKQDVLKVLRSLNRLLWGSVVCARCGRPVIECASGKCEKCMEEKGARGMAASLKKTLHGAFLASALEKLLEVSRKALGCRVNGLSRLKLEAQQKINGAAVDILNYLIEAPKAGEAALGVTALGLAMEFREAIQTLMNAALTTGKEGSLNELNEVALEGLNLLGTAILGRGFRERLENL